MLRSAAEAALPAGSDKTNGGHGSIGRGARRTLSVLMLVSFFNYLDRMVLSVLLEPIKHDLALSDTEAGLLTGLAFALFYALFGIPIARLADRGNKARILAGCMTLWSVMTAVSGGASTFAMLFLARMAVGVGEAGCMPTSFSIIADRFAARRRPLAVSLFQAAGLLGIATGMFGAGLAGQYLGWRVTLALVGLLGLPVALLVLLALPGKSGASGERPGQPLVGDVLALLRRPPFLHLVAGISLASFATYGIIQWSASFFIRSHGATLGQVGVLTGVSTGLGGITGTLAGGIAAGWLLHKNPRWDLWYPGFAYALAFPLFAAALLCHATSVAFGFNFGATAVAASASGVALAAAQRFAEPARRATANALMLMISALAGVGLGPVFIGAVSDHLHASLGAESLRWGLLCSTVMFVWAALHFWLAARSAALCQDEA